MDTELKKAKTDEVKKRFCSILMTMKMLKLLKKAAERLQRAEQFNPEGDFSEYRRRNAEAMKLLKSCLDND